MTEFDLRTLVALLAITTLISSLSLYLFYRLLPEVPGLKQAAIASGCQAFASLLTLEREAVGAPLSILLSNGGYFLSFAFYYQSARLFDGRRQEWLWPGLVIALLLPFFLFLPGHDYLWLRIALSSLGFCVLGLMVARVLWQSPQPLPGRRGLSLVFAVFGMIAAARVVSMLHEPVANGGFLEAKGHAVYMIFIWAIIESIAITVGMIVMTSERLREALKARLEDVEAARDVAHKVLSEQQNFLALLSHEFKTPLSIINANADAILTCNKAPDPFLEDSVQRIQNNSSRLSGLVDGCLNDAWISHAVDSGDYRLERIDVTGLLRELCEEYDVPLVLEGSERPPTVNGDPVMLQILFSNLIGNARKYAAQKDRVEVRLSSHGDTLEVSVTNDGAAIPEDQQRRVFEKYYRADNRQQVAGSGLGLYFAKRIVERHDGTITLESGALTRFSISLPLSDG